MSYGYAECQVKKVYNCTVQYKELFFTSTFQIQRMGTVTFSHNLRNLPVSEVLILQQKCENQTGEINKIVFTGKLLLLSDFFYIYLKVKLLHNVALISPSVDSTTPILEYNVSTWTHIEHPGPAIYHPITMSLYPQARVHPYG